MAFRFLTLTALMAGAVSAVTINLDDYNCPDGWSINTLNSDKYYCCWGAGHINNDDGYCCVNNYSSSSGGGSGKISSDSEIYSDCFPFCDRKRQFDDTCAEKIPFSASDYSERVSAASKSIMSKAGSTATDAPASTTAEPTNSSDDDATTTGSDGPTETGDDATESGDSDSAEETESDNAGPIPTGDAMVKIGGAVAAAALFAL